MKRIIILVVVCCVLTGCAAKNSYNLSESKIDENCDLSRLKLDLQIEENKIYAVDISPNPSESFRVEPQPIYVQSGTNLHTAAAASAGVNITAQLLLNASHKNSLQQTANKKADPMRYIYPKDRLLTLLKETILEESLTQEQYTLIELDKAKDEDATLFILQSQPEIRFSNDLARLEMKLNVSIVPKKWDEPIYQNSFEYWSPLVGPTLTEVDRGPMWTRDDAELMATYLKEGCKEVMEMLAYDLAANRNPNQTNSPRFRTQKIFNERGHYYMRGYPLKTENGRVWMKDLRGNIRSFHGDLKERPES